MVCPNVSFVIALDREYAVAHDLTAIDLDRTTSWDHINMSVRVPVGTGMFGIGVTKGYM